MKQCISVENIKCGGCANSIRKKLSAIEAVNAVDVDVESGQVSFEAETDATLEEVKSLLRALGYPETGTQAGLSAAGAKAKSYVSCALGKMSDENESLPKR
ncbi:MAG: heavy metal-associated domain-containing protein [Hydrogenovibrio sp.]|nr:heavy metal-associated domain-containing protein [Hydrogenovibrio sp.]